MRFNDAAQIMTGTVVTAPKEYYCPICEERRYKDVVISSSDYQGEGVSLNIMDVHHQEKLVLSLAGDCRYVVIEQSSDAEFTSLTSAKAMMHDGTFKVKDRYIRLNIVGGKRTIASIGGTR